MADKIETIPILAEAGGLGFKRYSGYISEEFHADLKGKLAARVYREMADNDPLIGGALRGMRMLVRQADWPVKPADTDDVQGAAYWAEKLEESMYDMETPWRSIVDEMMSMVQYGFCLMWIAYKIRRGDDKSRLLNSKYDDGLWAWRNLSIRKQDTIERWLYAEDDETLIGAQQLPPPTYKLANLPMDRLIHLRYETAAGSPEGKSGIRNCYRSYYLKTHKEEIEGTGIERDLSGYPVIEVPIEIMNPEALPAQKAIRTLMESNVRKVKRDELEGIVMPASEQNGKKTGYTFRLMSSGGTRAIDVNQSIVRDRVDMLVSLLWEFSLLGTVETGSRSLSSDKTQLASVALGAVMDIVTETLNLSSRAELMRLNRVPAHLWPEHTHGDIEKENIIEWVNGLTAAANGGFIVPTDEDEKKVREKFGLEQRGPDDTILAPPVEPEPFGFGLEHEEKSDPGIIDRIKSALGMDGSDSDPEPETEEDTAAMTAEEAAQWLNVSRSTIMTAIRNGKLPGAKIGGTYRILKEDLVEFMKPSAA